MREGVLKFEVEGGCLCAEPPLEQKYIEMEKFLQFMSLSLVLICAP